MQIFKLTSET